MASTATKWLIGCGVGCLIVVMIVAALIFGGVLFVRGFVEEAQRAESTSDALEERFGEVRDYRPAPGGAIPAGRIETFLAVRETVAPARAEMERIFATLGGPAGGETDESARGVFSKVRAGFGLIPRILEYFAERNDALLQHGMGLGEYYYIYSVAYYSWLEKSPADGPPFRLEGQSSGNWRIESGEWESESGWQRDEVREDRIERLTQRANRLITPMLRHQLEELEAGEYDETWRDALAQEIEALERDRDRLPWADGAPGVITASLEPFRDALEKSYSAPCNGLEFGMEHNH